MAQHEAEAFVSGEPSCRRVSDDCTDNSREKLAPIDPEPPTRSKSRFGRRNSMKANSSNVGMKNCDEEESKETLRRRSGLKKEHNGPTDDELSASSPRHSGQGGSNEPPRNTSSLVEKSVARICGSSRSKCGYCGGKRLHVLGVEDGYNKIVTTVDGTNKHEPNGGGGSAQGKKKMEEEEVDETKTSKSYGLLFDCLPYGTYEDLINHGWRRSGKHLYRPHNFESCCPAISIRLNVLKFASRSGNDFQPSDDLARSILVRGSKSQRKVGKAMLRAIESYNSKCAPVQANILSIDDSVHTSHVANMQLDDSIRSLSGSGRREKGKDAINPTREEFSYESESKRQHKKLRKRSPDRDHDKLDDDLLIAEEYQNIPPIGLQTTSPPSSHNNDAVGYGSLPVNLEHLQHTLEKLSGMVYRTITNEAMKSLASNHQGGTFRNGNETKTTRWAWWDKDEADKAIRIPKWCTFKVSKSRRGSKDVSSASATGVSVTIFTSACAAAAGRSRGGVKKDVLIREVVESLRMLILDDSQQNDGDNKHQVTEVSCHEKSGHVHVILDAPPCAVIAEVKPSKCASESKKDNLSSGQRRCSDSVDSVDKVDPIAEFITRHTIIAHKINKPNLARNADPHQRRTLTVRSVPVHESSMQPEVHQLFCRYQTAVHGDSDPFFGNTESINGKDDDHDYAYYQQKNPLGFLDVEAAYCHLDKIRRSKIKASYLTFYRFLCETPVVQDEFPSKENPPSEDGYDIHVPFGTYHQQYRLSTSEDEFDGPLIAVGVADILPHCFSSVYAFYDPILSNSLELGKYTALREIEWVRRASQFRPELHYYYLGYYIHSCQKMTYKAEYKPCELLCPVNMKWVDFEDGKKRLEECSPTRHCCALFTDSPSPDHKYNAGKPKFKIEDIMLDIGEKEPRLVQVGMLNRQGREFIDPHVNEFASEIGIDMCSKFVIKLR